MPRLIHRRGLTGKPGGRIIYDAGDFLGGLHPQYVTAAYGATALKSSNQLLFSKLAAALGMNPYRYLGLAQPGNVSVTPTNYAVATELNLKGVGYDAAAYVIGSTARINKIDVSGVPALVNAGSFPHDVGGSTHLYDIAIYNSKVSGTNATRIFYSYTTNSVWNVGMFDFSTFADTFMSSTPATPLASPYTTGGAINYPHPMIVGDDDVLYIGDRNFVHAYDGQVGSNGTFSAAVLTLPYNFVITSFAKYPLYLTIHGYFKTNTSGAPNVISHAITYFWNYVDLDITRAISLNDNYVSEAFEYLGTIGCFTSGRNSNVGAQVVKTSRLRIFDGKTFKIVAEFNDDPPVRGGVQVSDSMIKWNSNGHIYSWGSPLVGIPTALNKTEICQGTLSGMLATFAGNYMIASSGLAGAGGIEYFTGGYGIANLATIFAEPMFLPYHKGRIETVKVRFGLATSATTSRSFYLSLVDRDGSYSQIISADTGLTITHDNLTQIFNFDVNNAPLIAFDALKLVLEWGSNSGTVNAVSIARVEVDYEEINANPLTTS